MKSIAVKRSTWIVSSIILLIFVLGTLLFSMIVRIGLDSFMHDETARAGRFTTHNLASMQRFGNTFGFKASRFHTFVSNDTLLSAYRYQKGAVQLWWLESGWTISSDRPCRGEQVKFLTRNGYSAALAIEPDDLARFIPMFAPDAVQSDLLKRLLAGDSGLAKPNKTFLRGYRKALISARSASAPAQVDIERIRKLIKDNREKQLLMLAHSQRPQVLSMLAETRLLRVLLAVSRSKHADSQVLERVYQSVRGQVRQQAALPILLALARHKAGSDALHKRLFRVAGSFIDVKSRIELYSALAENTQLSDNLREQLFAQNHTVVDLRLARNPHTTGELLDKILQRKLTQTQSDSDPEQSRLYRSLAIQRYVASHPRLHTKSVATLIKHKDLTLLQKLAQNKQLDTDAIQRLLRSNHLRIYAGLLLNPALSSEQLNDIVIKRIGNDAWFRHNRHSGYPPASRRQRRTTTIANDQKIRNQLYLVAAKHPAADKQLLDFLLKTDSIRVVLAIAARPMLSDRLKQELLNRRDAGIYRVLLDNPSVTSADLGAMINSYRNNAWVYHSLERLRAGRHWRHVSLPLGRVNILLPKNMPVLRRRKLYSLLVLNDMYFHKDIQSQQKQFITQELKQHWTASNSDLGARVRRTVATLKLLHPILQTSLAADNSQWVRVTLAGQSNLPATVVQALARDSEASVRLKLARHEQITPGLLAQLAGDQDRSVRKAVLFNSKVSAQDRAQLLSTFFLRDRGGCAHLLLVERNKTQLDRVDWATRGVGKTPGGLLFFSVQYRDGEFALVDNQIIRSSDSYSSYLKLSTRKHHFITRFSQSGLQIHKSFRRDSFVRYFAKPLALAFSYVAPDYGFRSRSGRVSLNKESYVYYWLQSNSYVIVTYYVFLAICYLVLTAFWFWMKARGQRQQLAQENSEMQKNIRRKAYIAEMLGHEIKSPLHSLSSMLNDEKSEKYLARIRNAVARTSDVEAILSGLEGEVKVQEINAFLRSYADNTREYKNIAGVTFESAFTHVNARVSLEDLEIVLDHLVDNANDFRFDDTDIVISSARVADGVEIRVSNQGPPVADDIKEHIFNYGVSQRKTARSAQEPGLVSNMGQGLFVVREKLADMQASIRLQQSDAQVSFIILLRRQ